MGKTKKEEKMESIAKELFMNSKFIKTNIKCLEMSLIFLAIIVREVCV